MPDTHLGAYHLGPGHAWMAPAMAWPVRLASRETPPDHIVKPGVMQAVLDCAECGQGILITSPDTSGDPYILTTERVASSVLAHIRQCHEHQVIPPASAGL